MPAHLYAVHFGHHHVAHDDVGENGEAGFQAYAAVVRHMDVVGGGQALFQRCLQLLVVLHYQQGGQVGFVGGCLYGCFCLLRLLFRIELVVLFADKLFRVGELFRGRLRAG